MTDQEHRQVLEAMQTVHRAELGKLGMQLALYRAALEENGIQPPNKEAEELLRLWRNAATVVTTASEFTAVLGSAKELLDPNLTISVWNT